MAHPRKAPLVHDRGRPCGGRLARPVARCHPGQGIDLFTQRPYDKADPGLRAVIRGSAAQASQPDAPPVLAKSHMAVGDLDEAERTPRGTTSQPIRQAADYPEALYQKGRLLYMQEQYEPAVQVLQGFLSAYPKSAFVPNAYFWVGESLYALGKLDEALTVYRKVVRDFPSSFKAEAAQYRVSLIELGRREAELAKLLKWSHEDSLKTIEEYQRRERAYEQAIEAYQKRLAASSTGQYGQYERTIAELRERARAQVPPRPSLAAELAQGAAGVTVEVPADAAEPAAERRRRLSPKRGGQRAKELLALKEEALALKEEYLAICRPRRSVRHRRRRK